MPDSIGHILKSAREDSGLTLRDLAQVTKIPYASLAGLETGAFEGLPAPVFVRGFIRAYCKEVDLDASEVLAQYDAFIHQSEYGQVDPDQQAALAPLLFSDADASRPSHRGLQISHVLLLILALVTFIVAYVTAGTPSGDQLDTAQRDAAGKTSSVSR